MTMARVSRSHGRGRAWVAAIAVAAALSLELLKASEGFVLGRRAALGAASLLPILSTKVPAAWAETEGLQLKSIKELAAESKKLDDALRLCIPGRVREQIKATLQILNS